MLVIDGDGHLLEPLSLWSEFTPRRLHDRIYVQRDARGRSEAIVLGDLRIPHRMPTTHPFGLGDALRPGGLSPGRPAMRPYEDSEPGGWDPKRRLAIHDAEDIAAAVLFPTWGLMAGAITDPEVAVAASQAINDWAASYAAAAPGELFPVATLPQHHPEACADELRRCVERHGFVGACMRPNPTLDGRRLDHPDFEVLWRAADDLGVPVCVHNAASNELPQLGADRYDNFVTLHAGYHAMEGMMAFATLFQGGVFDRHASLKFGFMEATCGWAPFWIERLHEHFEVVGWTMPGGPRRDPRGIFVEQCVVGCEGDEAMVPVTQRMLGEQSVIWASDFPHYDTEPPFSGAMLARDDLTTSQREAVLRGAALKFYGLDWERIRSANARRRAAESPKDAAVPA